MSNIPKFTCKDCRWHSEHKEWHPYGSTQVAELISDCLAENAPDKMPLDATECPSFEPWDAWDDPRTERAIDHWDEENLWRLR